MSDTVNFCWNILYSTVVGPEPTVAPEVNAFLNPVEDVGYAITGVGATIKDNDFTMIELMVASLQNLGEAQMRKFPSAATDKPDLIVSAGDGEVVVGIGMRASNSKLSTLAIWARALDPNTGLLQGDLHEYLVGEQGHNLESGYVIDENRFGVDGLGTTIITGVGARCDGDSNVTTMTLQFGQIETIIPQVAQQQAAKVKQALESPKGLDNTYDFYLIPTLLDHLVLANDAYYSIQSDDFFQKGYIRVDWKTFNFNSVEDWTTENNYRKFQDSKNGYWGISTSDSENFFVAFRGTQFSSLSDLATDMNGFAPTATAMNGGQTVFDLDPWQYGQTTMWIHSGFLTQYQSIAPDLRDQIESAFKNGNLKNLYLIGHSLGGALAQICAVDLSVFPVKGAPKPNVVTFGAPFVGDASFISVYQKSYASSNLVEQLNDFVAKVPALGRRTDGTIISMQKGAKVQLIPNPEWFPAAHELAAYYNFMSHLYPTSLTKNLPPLDVITSLELAIQTADVFGAGTDSPVYCRILGVDWGPLKGSFEQNSMDTFDLFKLFPNLAPKNKVVQDLIHQPVAFWLGSTSGFTYTWTLDNVEVYVNQVLACMLEYKQDIKGGKNHPAVRFIGGNPNSGI